MSTSKIDFLGPLVLIIGAIVIVYGLLMVFAAWHLRPDKMPSASRPRAVTPNMP